MLSVSIGRITVDLAGVSIYRLSVFKATRFQTAVSLCHLFATWLVQRSVYDAAADYQRPYKWKSHYSIHALI